MTKVRKVRKGTHRRKKGGRPHRSFKSLSPILEIDLFRGTLISIFCKLHPDMIVKEHKALTSSEQWDVYYFQLYSDYEDIKRWRFGLDDRVKSDIPLPEPTSLFEFIRSGDDVEFVGKLYTFFNAAVVNKYQVPEPVAHSQSVPASPALLVGVFSQQASEQRSRAGSCPELRLTEPAMIATQDSSEALPAQALCFLLTASMDASCQNFWVAFMIAKQIVAFDWVPRDRYIKDLEAAYSLSQVRSPFASFA